MTAPEIPPYNQTLVDDIIDMKPELADYYYPMGLKREEVAFFIAAVFGKA